MGNSFYCVYQKNDGELKLKTDLTINNNENKEIFQRDSNSLMLSNYRTLIDSPLENQENLCYNPIPEIVIIRQKKKKRKIIYKNNN